MATAPPNGVKETSVRRAIWYADYETVLENQWRLPATPYPYDREPIDHVMLSAGYPVAGGFRSASLSIGGRVVDLKPHQINALAVALLRVNMHARIGAS